jgi:hypothetical protein
MSLVLAAFLAPSKSTYAIYIREWMPEQGGVGMMEALRFGAPFRAVV